MKVMCERHIQGDDLAAIERCNAGQSSAQANVLDLANFLLLPLLENILQLAHIAAP